MKLSCVADIEGSWVDPHFDSGLIERCKRYWSVPVTELPNEMPATYLRQRIALQLIIPEARKRLEAGVDDDSELYDGELAQAFEKACDSLVKHA
jgi:hypothetical protein